MKKILYVHGNVNTIGGVETFIENSLFHHKRFEPHIIFINDGELPRRVKEKGFENIIILNGGRLRNIYKTLRNIIKIIKYAKRNNIVASIGIGHHAWIYAGLVSKIMGIKGIFYFQGVLNKSDVSFTSPIGFIASRLKPLISFASSIASKESLERFQRSDKITILYPGIEVRKFEEEANTSKIRKQLKISSDARIISTIGRIQKGKGQEYFVKALPLVHEQFPDTYFLIAGTPTFENDSAYFNYIKTLVEKFHIKEKVIFTGFKKDICEIIALSNLIVCPSIMPEGFGFIVVESMVAGKPVVATNFGGPAEIIKDGENGVLVPPKDEKALASAIIKLFKDDELRNRIAEKAKHVAMAKFSIDRCIMEMEDVLERIL